MEHVLTDPWRWFWGIVVALGFGWVFTGLWIALARTIAMLRMTEHVERTKWLLPRTLWRTIAYKSWRGTLTGLLERFVFMHIVLFGVDGALTAMGAWIAAKLAANWGTKSVTEIKPPADFVHGLVDRTVARDVPSVRDTLLADEKFQEAVRSLYVAEVKRGRMAALEGGLVSMSFATLGGMIASGKLYWPW
jgi:hypothetical protein